MTSVGGGGGVARVAWRPKTQNVQAAKTGTNVDQPNEEKMKCHWPQPPKSWVKFNSGQTCLVSRGSEEEEEEERFLFIIFKMYYC